MDMTITFPQGKKVNAEYRGFVHETDQSIRAGGNGDAPEPFDLFLASIGTCAGIYVKSFCDQRGLDSQKISITQKMNYNPVERRIDTINIIINLPEDFPEKYHSAIEKAAGLCTVKRHLEKPPEFRITTQNTNVAN